MSDTLWKALRDAYIKGAQDVHDCTKLIDWKAEAESISTEYRNQIIQELIEKAKAEAKDLANSSGMPLEHTWQSQVAWWLKSQMEGGE